MYMWGSGSYFYRLEIVLQLVDKLRWLYHQRCNG